MKIEPSSRALAALLATSILWISPAPAIAHSADQASVDEIFFNGDILTPDGTAEALAVRDGTIVAVGSSEEVLKLPHNVSGEVDLDGQTLMPGLYDSHVHLLYAGQDLLSCKFARGSKANMIFDTVKACADRAQPGDWIIGGSWVAAALLPGEQTRALLDEAAPNNPVILNDESLHSVWVNSRALELAGITRDMPDPEGGVIDRDAQGEPTGVLRETATAFVESILPPPSLEAQEAAVKAATDRMLSYGIVGLTDAGIWSSWIEGLSRYAKSGALKQYVRGCMSYGRAERSGQESNAEDRLIADRLFYEGGRLKLDCIKLMLDGVPIESRTASMVEPYLPHKDAHGHAMDSEDRGILMFDTEELKRIVTRFDRDGLNVKMHAAGDGAVRQAADAIAAARTANGYSGPRHDIAHNTFVARSDVDRGRELGFTWELSPYIWWPTPITANDITAAVGPERMERLWPARDVIETGALVVIGSDWPVVPSADPWLALETLVTRKVPGATGDAIGEGQRITRAQALRLLTSNGAAYMGRLDRSGTLETGKMADMIIVDRNPLTVPIGELHDTKVLRTYIAGELVYDASSVDD